MILSKVKFAITGSNRTRLLNKLKEYDIVVFYLQTDAETTFWVWQKDEKKVKELAEILGVQYQTSDNSGVQKLINKTIKHAPYIVAVVIFSILICVSMLFVFDTKVVAQNDVYAKKVEMLLQENNIANVAVPKSKIDLRQIENLIVSNIEEVSFATCYLKGYSLIVQIVATENPMTTEKKRDLQSNFDAVVTRVIVRNGTSEVAVGESVKAGDILIGGYHIADNTPSDGEETGDIIEVAADGEVYGKVYTHKRFAIPPQAFNYVKTGSKKIVRELGFGKWTVVPSKKVPYEFYEKRTSNIKLFAILPIRVTTHEYIELQKVQIEQNAYIENLKSKFESEFLESLNLEAKLISKDYDIKEIDGIKYLDIFYETERRIDNGGNNY